MQQEQWEFEYERIFGSGHFPEGHRGDEAPVEVKVAFHAGWDAALAAILERFSHTAH